MIVENLMFSFSFKETINMFAHKNQAKSVISVWLCVP